MISVNVKYKNKDIGKIVHREGITYAVPISKTDDKLLKAIIKPFTTFKLNNNNADMGDAMIEIEPDNPIWINEIYRNVPPEYEVSLPEGENDKPE